MQPKHLFALCFSALGHLLIVIILFFMQQSYIPKSTVQTPKSIQAHVASQSQLEQIRAHKTEQKRKAEQLAQAKREAEQARKTQQLAQAKREAEQKKEAQRLVEEKRLQQQKQLASQLEQELALVQAQRAQYIQEQIAYYESLIQNTVRRHWFVEPDMENQSCRLQLKLSQRGVILDMRELDGSKRVCHAAKLALHKLDELPVPEDPEVFDKFREFILTLTL